MKSLGSAQTKQTVLFFILAITITVFAYVVLEHAP